MQSGCVIIRGRVSSPDHDVVCSSFCEVGVVEELEANSGCGGGVADEGDFEGEGICDPTLIADQTGAGL